MKTDSNNDSETNKLELSAQRSLRELYTSGNIEQHIDDLCFTLEGIVQSGLLTSDEAEQIESGMRESAKSQDEDEFCEQATHALSPLLKIYLEHPDQIENAKRETALRKQNFTPINDYISYGKADNLIHIHLSPAGNDSKDSLFSGVNDGLNQLANIVSDDESVQKITASSWIVAKHPRIMRRLGFTIVGPISEEFRQKHFQAETRPISSAVMSRKDFLAKYNVSNN